MFTFSAFIKNGFIAAVGKMADYQIILNAAGWYEKQVLTENDLAEIQAAIDSKNARIEAERLAAEETAKAEEATPEAVAEEPATEETEALFLKKKHLHLMSMIARTDMKMIRKRKKTTAGKHAEKL